MSAPVTDPAIPRAFEPIALLSRGRTFEVWDCWDERRVCRVVVKLPRTEARGDARVREQLLNEGRLLESLTHPHILRAYETVTEPVPMIVMETLGGETLSHTIDETGGLDPADIAHLGLHLTAALAQIHGRGHAHLDLKPSNVIGEAGRARLIDLGVAVPFGDTRPEVGTWSYMAPEQVSGRGLGPHTDVWGLGATLFECLCAHPPFDDADIEGEATGTGSGDDWPGRYPQLERRAKLTGESVGESPELDALVLDCLSPEPGSRPALGEVAARLEAIAGLPAGLRRVSRSIP